METKCKVCKGILKIEWKHGDLTAYCPKCKSRIIEVNQEVLLE